MNPKLVKIEQMAIATALKIAEEEEHNPTMLVLTGKGDLALGHISLKDKDLFKPTVLRILQDSQAIGYVFVVEGWRATGPVAERALRQGLAVRDLPPDDREEILTITVVERGTAYRTTIFSITQLLMGRLLRPLDVLSSEKRGTLEGRMVVLDW